MPTRSGAAGRLVVGPAPPQQDRDRDQRDRHEERAVAEQRGEAVAEARPGRAGQVGGERQGGEEAEDEHPERERIGAVPVELGPGGVADPRRLRRAPALAAFAAGASGAARRLGFDRDGRDLDPRRDFVVATKSP